MRVSSIQKEGIDVVGLLLTVALIILIYMIKSDRKREAQEQAEAERRRGEAILRARAERAALAAKENAQRQEAQEHGQTGQRRDTEIHRARTEQADQEQKASIECEHKKDKGYKINTYRVAGTSFRSNAIASLGEENDDYGASKRDLIEEEMTDEEIYQYRFHPQKVELVPEPDNEFDPNAIKVIVDGVHVGYIKKGSCAHIKKLLAEDRIQNINCKIGGGKFKIITEDYDPEKDKDVYTLERDEREYWVELKIKESTKE